MPENLEKIKQEEYYNNILRGINMDAFLSTKLRDGFKKIAQPAPTINIPSVEEAKSGGGGEPPKTDVPSTPDVDVASTPPPDASMPLDTTLPPAPAKKRLTRKEKDELVERIDDIEDAIDSAQDALQISTLKDEIMEEVKEYYSDLQKELDSLKSRKIPERRFFDTEGAYRDNLYGMATHVLDDLLPELFDEIPEYKFNAVQISRVFDDGTVADALISLMVVVPKDGMKYEFKTEVPVLNGLMQYPMYLQRGRRIVPLLKSEIQKELESMSYRKVDMDIPYEQKKLFTNNGENIHRRTDNQKWYNVAPNEYNPVNMPPDHKYQLQRGKTR